MNAVFGFICVIRYRVFDIHGNNDHYCQ